MNREADLEVFLAKYDEEDYRSYQSIKNAAKKIWEHPRLAWYTDHGPKHSERIIFHLNRLCTNLLRYPDTKTPHYGLVPAEVFLLLAAAWLHDIGMQDMSDLDGRSVDDLDKRCLG